MEIAEVLKLLEEVMDLDEGALEVSTELADIEEWDSLAKLYLMAAAKKNFGIAITANEVKSFVTVRDVCVLFENK